MSYQPGTMGSPQGLSAHQHTTFDPLPRIVFGKKRFSEAGVQSELVRLEEILQPILGQ